MSARHAHRYTSMTKATLIRSNTYSTGSQYTRLRDDRADAAAAQMRAMALDEYALSRST